MKNFTFFYIFARFTKIKKNLLAQRQPDYQPCTSQTSKILALFDFDGTLTEKDTLSEFIRFFCTKEAKKYWTFFQYVPIWLFKQLGFISNQRARRKLISLYFGGVEVAKLERIAADFAVHRLPYLLKTKTYERLAWHLKQEHEVAIVTATPSLWLQTWCKVFNIRLIASELEIQKDVYTGRFATKNCTGAEKVKRIKATLDLDTYTYIYAYGKNRGDKQMLQLANESFFNY
jgi:phosphatidylglycerophosphatase C